MQTSARAGGSTADFSLVDHRHVGCGPEGSCHGYGGALSTLTRPADTSGVITIYTDGSCIYTTPDNAAERHNTGPGGWAWWVDEERHNSGRCPETTSLRMEIQAIIDALDSPAIPADVPVTIATDNRDVVTVMQRAAESDYTRWERLPRSIDWESDFGYWETLADAVTDRSAETYWVKVKAHASIPGNTHADRLARAQARVLAGLHPRVWKLGMPRMRRAHNVP